MFKFDIDFFLIDFRLVGDVLLATGFLSYTGPFNQTYRNKLRDNWERVLYRKGIPYSENLNITAMLVDNATVRHCSDYLLFRSLKGHGHVM